MNWKATILGSDPEDERLSSSLGLPPYRRWYCFGRKSPGILFTRLRSRYRPIAELRYAAQRVTRGYDDPALWSLNHALATLTVAGCRSMRKNALGYPAQFSEEYGGGEAGGWEKWDDILRRIEEGFQLWLDDDSFGSFDENGKWVADAEREAKFKEALALYAEWFPNLWD